MANKDKKMYEVQVKGNTITQKVLVWANDKKEAKKLATDHGMIPGKKKATKVDFSTNMSQVVYSKTVSNLSDF